MTCSLSARPDPVTAAQPVAEPGLGRATAEEQLWSAGGADADPGTATATAEPAAEPERGPEPMLDAIAGARSPDLAALSGAL